MKNLSTVLVVSSLALCALAVARFADVDLRAKLTGAGKGKAEWKTQDKGSRLRAEIQVEGERLAASSDYSVVVGTNAPFMVSTDHSGKFQFDQKFNDANRPTVNNGDSVTVEDSTSTIVLSGVLSNH